MNGDSDQQIWHHRTRSLSDTEKTLDALMKNIEDMLSEDLPTSHRRHSSNDSAMGESECITSPCQHHAHNDIMYNAPSIYNSVDSAISNHSSSNNFSSCEAVSYTAGDPPPSESTSTYTLNTPHVRMYSEPSVQSDSPLPSHSSLTGVNSPKFVPKMSPYYRGSLPVLTPDIENIISNRRSSSPLAFIRKIRKSSSTNSGKGFWSKKKPRHLRKSSPMGSLDDKMPEYQLQRSPILGRKLGWEPVNGTNTIESPAEMSSVLEVISDETIKGLTPRFHFVIQPVSEILI